MGVQVSVVLTRAKSTILFLDEEERGCLGGFGWMNFPRVKVFVNELVCGFSFLDRKWVEFSNFWDKGLVEFYSMVIGLGWGYVVCGFF